MTTSRPRAIVVGAGVIGAACAAALSRKGFLVTILEQGIPAGGTTAAGMGHLVVMDDSPAQLALTTRSVRLWRELAPELADDVEWMPTGTLWIADDAEQLAALGEKQALLASLQVPSEMLDEQGVREAEPNLRGGIAGALRVVDDAVVYPPAAARALLAVAFANGATIQKRRVDVIGPGEVRCGSDRLNADVVVNAAGARAVELSPGLPVVPRKGHLAISDRGPSFCRHQIVETGYLTSAHDMSSASVAFNVQPRRTGQVLIGSSRELVGWDATTNQEILQRMLSRAVSYMPSLANRSIIRTWTGFRPASPDGLPLIGRWGDDQTFVAAGHEGLGITTATTTGEIIASLATGQAIDFDIAPYDPMRSVP